MNRFLATEYFKKIRNRRIKKMYENYLSNQSWAYNFKKKYFSGDLVLKGKCIMDFGCGRGRHVALLSQLGGTVVGMDIIPHEFWRKIPNAYFLLGSDKELLGIRDGSFDIVIIMQVLMYLDNGEKTLRQIFRILKDSGYLLIQVTNKKNLYTFVRGKTLIPNLGIKRYYTIDEIRDLLKSTGFVIERLWTEKFYAPFFPIPINYFLEVVLPSWTLDITSFLTPYRFRGMINVLARKYKA
jgi:SAM-dependent methyltransferase